MTKHYSLHCSILLIISVFVHSSCASKNNVTKLVDEVCVKTSNYSFCIESLHSDPHTPESDSYGLAYVAFRLAYLNATATRDYIGKVLKKATSTHYHMQLEKCGSDYEKAISAIETAYNDLNSETFFELADLAGVASHGAQDCQDTFQGCHHSRDHNLSYISLLLLLAASLWITIMEFEIAFFYFIRCMRLNTDQS